MKSRTLWLSLLLCSAAFAQSAIVGPKSIVGPGAVMSPGAVASSPPPANVQKGNHNVWTSGTSFQVGVTALTLGNLITIGANFDSTISISSIGFLPSGAGTCSSAGVDVTATGSAWKASVWTCVITTGGATSVVLNLSGTPTFAESFVEEWSNVSTVDKVAGTTGTSTSPNSGASATTTAANEVIYGYIIPNSGTLTKGASYTVATQPVADLSEYKIVSSTGTYSADGTMGTNTVWTAQVVTIK